MVSQIAYSLKFYRTIKAIFSEAESFQADISAWSTGRVFDMSNAFFRAHSFGGNVGSWDVSNVVDFEQMFGETYLTVAADLSAWTTTSATNMNVCLTSLSIYVYTMHVSQCLCSLLLCRPCSTCLPSMEILLILRHLRSSIWPTCMLCGQVVVN